MNIYIVMGASVRFEPEVVREEEFRNTQEPIEEVFDEAGRSCVRLLWAALASKFGKQRRRRPVKAARLKNFSIEQIHPYGIWTKDKRTILLTHHQKTGASGQHPKPFKSEKKSPNGVTSGGECIRPMISPRAWTKQIWAIDRVEVGARKWPNDVGVGAVFANLRVAKQKEHRIHLKRWTERNRKMT